LDDSNPQRLWVYFGSGRFFNRDDIPQAKKMTFYGVKEPIHTNGTKSWGTVTGSLFNSTDVVIQQNGTCIDDKQDCVFVYKGGAPMTGAWTAGSWQNLADAAAVAPGWRVDFSPAYERVLGQAAVLGGAVLFTSYTPSNDVCSFEGTSKLWALYYKTGTAFYRPILGVSGSTLVTSADLGQGMALTPNLHLGEQGSTAFIQSSTGAIETIKIENPESVRSGTLFWRKNVD
jgi:type IV pilus assembly protein PilY1